MKIYDIFLTYNQKWSEFEIYSFLTAILVLAIILSVLIILKKIKLRQAVAMVLLYTVIFVILESTVFSRELGVYYGYKPELFWSWRLAASGDAKYLEYIVLNIILFIPAGILIPFAFSPLISLFMSPLIGFLTSFSIELLQFYLKRGVFETDDIFNNTLGCILGTLVVDIIWLIIFIIKKIVHKIKSRK